ncbi:PglL family O-oligosaccharyltransferase [Ramlibacter henchirensis]|uniref:PglL family O-oligosaccharyltransferase n=1 Tax=Ramlibacter henchirensis TaxID=204072 RepID=UPI0014316F54|nr:Wzy polymerase domain-containing protein [Ramlibacter henchirensis]
MHAATVLAALPWLNPFAHGPISAAVPWLTSLVVGLALWTLALRSSARPPWRLAWALAPILIWAWLRQLPLQQETVFLAGGLALFLVGAAIARDDHVSRGVCSGLLLAALLTALFGLLQYFGLSAPFSPWMNAADAGEAYGNLRQPNQYASLCWLGMAVLLWGAHRLPRGVAFALAALLAIGSAASVSRTGMLQGLVLTVLSAAWPGPQRRFRLQLCAVAALAYFGATLMLPFALQAATGALPARTLWGRIGGGESCSSRLVLWSNVLHLIAVKPWAGWGWGELDFAHFMTLYPGERFCDILDNAHSLPLHLAVELGVPAALAICLGGAWWILAQRPWKERDPRKQLAWALLAVILLHSLLEYPLWYGPFQLATGAALGWLLASSEPSPAIAARRFPAAAALIVALFVAAGYAAWDYVRISQIYLQPAQRSARWSADPLGHARRSFLFGKQARFAELVLADLSRENAERMYRLSSELLHYSPEPRVIEWLIESATMTGREQEAVLHLARYKAAFPTDYAAWRQLQGRMPPPAARNRQG